MLNLLRVLLRKFGLFEGQSGNRANWRDRYSVGRGTFGDPQVLCWEDGTTLTVGAYCSIAYGVQIFLGGNHRMDLISTYPFAEMLKKTNLPRGSVSKGDVVIGNDVWLGTKCTIMSGVTIGDGAVIGAHAVVSKSVPPYAVVVGNPAKVARTRFSESAIKTLLEIQWWNWDEKIIEKALPIIMSNNINALVEFERDLAK